MLDGVSFEINEGDFVLLFGPTGSGKSTLLSLLKPELSPKGERTGELRYKGEDVGAFTGSGLPEVAFVRQFAEHQTVTDKVRHELVFGMENLRFPQSLMKRRLAEAAAYFALDGMLDERTSELSGGQKQLLALASVMATGPKAVILDEPTSQLDPVAASQFITKLKKINEDYGVTVIITEHRLDNVLPVSTKLMALGGGRVTAFGDTAETVGKAVRGGDEALLRAMPGSVRLFSALGGEGNCPLSVREGRAYLTPERAAKLVPPPARKDAAGGKQPALRMKNVFFRYEREKPDVLSGLSLKAYPGEISCVLGANGSGKSTLLGLAAGLLRQYSGKIEIFGKKIKDYRGQSLYDNCVAMLPQDPEAVFTKSTLGEELAEVGADPDSVDPGLGALLSVHPYDLSGGERQLAALCKVTAVKPRLLLLDEPTKGLDPQARNRVCDALLRLRDGGAAIVAVTHDVEFAARCADRAALLFGGEIVCEDEPRAFFTGNTFYTTPINVITRDACPGIITADDLDLSDGGREALP